MPIHIKRVYVEAEKDDGVRILVDRLWPRGLSKDAVRMDEWLRDIAPSDSLRKWFGHRPERWPQFRRRYWKELESPERRPLLEKLRSLVARDNVTLLYAAKDEERNNAVVIAEVVSGHKR